MLKEFVKIVKNTGILAKIFFRCFNHNMNIIKLNFNKTVMPTFMANKEPKITFVAKDTLPKKIELTEMEAQYNELNKEYHIALHDAYVQQQNLRSYYCKQDKFEYREAMKKKNQLNSKLDRMSKKAGIDRLELENTIEAKKQYNRYAPKLFRAETKSALKEVEKLIFEVVTNKKALVFLAALENQCKKMLKK